VDAFVEDDLVASLLLVHGLHPETLERRVDAALAGVRPLLASHGGDVELLDIDADAGAVLIRLLGSCDGCPSSAVTLQSAVERAITEAAPEIVRIEVDEPSKVSDRGAPVTLGTKAVAVEAGYPEPTPTRPVYTDCPAEMATT
jgi:Fe-S cluster biogenesis protein NfuA